MYYCGINNVICSFHKRAKQWLEYYENRLIIAKNCKDNKHCRTCKNGGHLNEIIYLEKQIKTTKELIKDLEELIIN